MNGCVLGRGGQGGWPTQAEYSTNIFCHRTSPYSPIKQIPSTVERKTVTLGFIMGGINFVVP